MQDKHKLPHDWRGRKSRACAIFEVADISLPHMAFHCSLGCEASQFPALVTRRFLPLGVLSELCLEQTLVIVLVNLRDLHWNKEGIIFQFRSIVSWIQEWILNTVGYTASKAGSLHNIYTVFRTATRHKYINSFQIRDFTQRMRKLVSLE